MKETCIERLAENGYLVYEDVLCNNTCRPEELAMVISSFSSLGYTLKVEDIKRLSKLDTDLLTEFYNTNYSVLQSLCGAHVKHKVFYKNFPHVENISALEAVIRAILHYITVSEDSDGFMSQDILDFERQEIHNPNKKVLKLMRN